MKITIAQLNYTVGDLSGNARKILEAAKQAEAAGSELIVTSELSICAYNPRDLLLRDGFVDDCLAAVTRLASELPSHLGVLVGHPAPHPERADLLTNAVSLLSGGVVQQTVYKCLLPNYDVFDEERYFVHGPQPVVVPFQGLKLGVHICEDAWWSEGAREYSVTLESHLDPLQRLAEQGAEVFINLSASPFCVGKLQHRHEIVRKHVQRYRIPMIYVNQIGGHDDVVYDGSSFSFSGKGALMTSAPAFQESMTHFDLNTEHSELVFDTPRREQEMYDAIVLGMRDYFRRSGFTDCVLGLSGGIDSALAACLAADAVGAQHVHGILMPSRYSSEHSIGDALSLAVNLGMNHETIPIDNIHAAYEQLPVVSEDLLTSRQGLTEQNLQARIRGAIVMTRSNRHNWIALATGNKSEISVGYCTLYGDMCGGFAALSDLYKQDVYALSRYVNEKAGREIVPVSIIEKAPSAELAPNQFDQDTLPAYPILDAILYQLIEENCSPDSLFDEFSEETVRWVVTRLDRNEFKRRQLPLGVKLTASAFGTGRRWPMAAKTLQR